MSHYKRVIRSAALATSLLLGIGLAACSAGPDPSPTNGASTPDFPAALQPLLEGVSDEVVQMLWDVRQSGPGMLVWKDGGGSLHEGFREAYLADWEKLTGWTVRAAAPSPSLSELSLQVESGNPEWDVIEQGITINVAEEEGFLQEFSPAFSAFLDTLPPTARHSKTFVEYTKTAVGVAWNTDKWPVSGPHPATYADLFDGTRFPGKVCLYARVDTNPSTMAFASMADGVKPEDVFPLKVDRALSKLSTIKDDIVWWSSGAESVQFISDGECDKGAFFHGRIANLQKEDPTVPVEFSFESAVMYGGSLALPKGLKNQAAAESAIAFGLTAHRQCELINTGVYGVAIDTSCLSDFGKKWAVTPDRLTTAAVVVNDEWIREDVAGILAKFEEWQTSP